MSKKIYQVDNSQYQDKELIAFDLYGTCIHRQKQFFGKGFSIGKDLKTILETNPIDINEMEKGKIEFNGKHFKISSNDLKNIKKDIASILLYPDFNGIIEYLKSKGYKTAVVSNLAKPYEEPLRKLIPSGSFDYEALSFNVGAMKPDKEIFKYLKDLSGIDYEKMVLVGDSLRSDVEGANNLGIKPIYVNRSHRTPIENTEKHGINLIQITTLDQLKNIL